MSSKFDDEEEELSYQYKVILLGDGAVGKTSIATRFASNAFSQNYKQTVGVDFFIKRINLEKRKHTYMLTYIHICILSSSAYLCT